MWKVWKRTLYNPKICKNKGDFNEKIIHTITKKYPHFSSEVIRNKNVDIVENYFPMRFSPIFTTSPAPIVINKSPLIHFSNKKFSISSKDGK